MAECTCGALIAHRAMPICPQCGRSVREEWFDEKNDPVMRLRADVVAERPQLSKSPPVHSLVPSQVEWGSKVRRPRHKRAVVGPLHGEIQLIDQTTNANPVSQIAVVLGAKHILAKLPNKPKQISKSAYRYSSERIDGIAENTARCIRHLIESSASPNDWRRFGVVGPIALIFTFGDRRVYYILRLRRLNEEKHQTWIAEYRLGNHSRNGSDGWEICPMNMVSEPEWPRWTLIGAISRMIRISERIERFWQFRLDRLNGQNWKLPLPSERIAVIGDESAALERADAVLKAYTRFLILSGWTLEKQRGSNWYSLRFSRTQP